MPLIQIKLIEDVFSEAQKKEMIKKITDTMVSIEGKEYATGHRRDSRGGQEAATGGSEAKL